MSTQYIAASIVLLSVLGVSVAGDILSIMAPIIACMYYWLVFKSMTGLVKIEMQFDEETIKTSTLVVITNVT